MRSGGDPTGRDRKAGAGGNRSVQGVSRLLKPAEVARRLGVSRSWLYEAAKDGRIPSMRLGGPEGPLRFDEADLMAWIDLARSAWQPRDSAIETLRRVRDGIHAA